MIQRTNLLKTGATTLLFAVLLLTLSMSVTAVGAQDAPAPIADTFSSEVAIDWMTLLYDIVRAEAINAPQASRIYAYGGVTLYEAVLNGMPGNNSFAGQIQHMPDMPLPDLNKDHDWPTVASAALSTVYHGLFPDGSQETHDLIDAKREEWAELRGAEVSEAMLNRSLEYGDILGDAILEWVATDNFAETR